MHPLITIEGSKVENFPFKVGDRVLIKWEAPRGVTDSGTIDALHTSTQGGHKIVHAIMVLVDGYKKPQVVCGSIITKMPKNYQPGLFLNH